DIDRRDFSVVCVRSYDRVQRARFFNDDCKLATDFAGSHDRICEAFFCKTDHEPCDVVSSEYRIKRRRNTTTAVGIEDHVRRKDRHQLFLALSKRGLGEPYHQRTVLLSRRAVTRAVRPNALART